MMMARTKNGVVYRLEDIDKASRTLDFKESRVTNAQRSEIRFV